MHTKGISKKWRRGRPWGQAAPSRAVRRPKQLAIYATYSHASPVWTGRNETHELSLMPVGEVKSGTSAKLSLHVLAKHRHPIPAGFRGGHPLYDGETTNRVPLRAVPVERVARN